MKRTLFYEKLNYTSQVEALGEVFLLQFAKQG